MKTKHLILIIFTIVIVFGSLIAGYWYNNIQTEIQLRNLAAAEIQKVEIIHDEVFKVISQDAQVTDKFKKDFEDIYTKIMEGRYSGNSRDESLMLWMKENNPQYSTELYLKLMVDIEVLRNKFSVQQVKVQDIIREHNNLIQDPIKSLFIKNKEPIEYVVISSTITKDVIEKRVDDNIDLF